LEEPDTRLFLILWSKASAVNTMAGQPSPAQNHPGTNAKINRLNASTRSHCKWFLPGEDQEISE
jgi:hypothetical protein